MKMEHLGLVIGGLIPALLFAVDGLATKAASRTGISWAPFILVTGLAIAFAGACALYFDTERSFSWSGACFAVVKGSMWAIGCMLVVVALQRYQAPLAKLAPLYNMNALFAAAFALVLFGERAELSVARLMGGALMVVAGAALVASA